jgi:Zinc-finger associated domain (zf-AD)
LKSKFLTLTYFRARKWAEHAQRPDLMIKKLDNLTKYHLCSDHFSNDAFVDPNVDKSFLKLKKVPSIPMPKIFENNLLSTVQKVTKNPENFVNYSKLTAIDTSRVRTENNENARNVEVKIEEERLSKNQYDDQMEAETYTEYIDEDLEIVRADEIEESVDINSFCRLCARNSGDLIAIFDQNGEFNAETDCFRLMPVIIRKDDGYPQFACSDCLEKLQSCANIIDGFVMNQSLFVSE